MRSLFLTIFLSASLLSYGQSKTSIAFTLRITDPASQLYHVEILASGFKKEVIEFKMPVWTPGYYQILNYAKYVSNFKATDNTGKELKWEQRGKNSWKVTKEKVRK